jgi:geranylgeranyl pyrophosphate synthase
MQSNSLTALAINIIDKRGQSALLEASNQILENKYGDGVISEALKYYARTIFPRVMPIFPALINLSCELVGGKPEETKPLAAAMMLVTASGDIHDDIIDRSKSKFRRLTLFGKYGKVITLLAGDALLMHGMELLQNGLEHFHAKQRNEISNLMTRAMDELAEAEATETLLWKKAGGIPAEYLEVINHKATIAELQCTIGGILGGADQTCLAYVTRYGRAIGLLSTMKDEFLDLENYSEFKSRIANEMPPYPVVCAFQNEAIRSQFLPIIENKKFSKKDAVSIAQAVLNSVEVQQVKIMLRKIGEKELIENPLLQDIERGKDAAIILKALSTEM